MSRLCSSVDNELLKHHLYITWNAIVSCKYRRHSSGRCAVTRGCAYIDVAAGRRRHHLPPATVWVTITPPPPSPPALFSSHTTGLGRQGSWQGKKCRWPLNIAYSPSNILVYANVCAVR